jgi:long-chain acyl-CoA synthetase
MNLASNLADTTRAHADRMAVRVGDATTTYRELDEASAGVAGLLHERGLKPGDRVGIMLPNVAEFPMVYYGVLRAGGIVVPMNPLLKVREVAYYLSDSGARLIFAWHAFASDASGGAGQADAEAVVVDPASFPDLVASVIPDYEIADRDDQDTAVILYTSGTTGQPKGAELTHANLTSNAEVMRTGIIRPRPDDVIFGGLPLFHAFGQTCTLNVAVASGTCLTLLPRFNAGQALRIFAGHRVTIFAGVPTMYVKLLAQPDRADYDVSALRMCISGGAAMPAEVLRGFEEAFGCQVLEGYGLSETSPVASFSHPDRKRKPGTIGTPIPGVQMRVVDKEGGEVPQGEVGEIVIRGPNVMKGYWHRPKETAEAIRDGWFHTGDLGRTDEDGYFSIVGRKKDLIIRGGYNIYPREIEEVLYEHPAVAEAAVIGLPNPVLGEEVGAAVVLKPGATVTAGELRDYVKARVAAYKYPRHVWIAGALPKGRQDPQARDHPPGRPGRAVRRLLASPSAGKGTQRHGRRRLYQRFAPPWPARVGAAAGRRTVKPSQWLASSASSTLRRFWLTG